MNRFAAIRRRRHDPALARGRSGFRNLLPKLGAAVLLLTVWNCFPVDEITLEDLWFNERIRVDLGAVNAPRYTSWEYESTFYSNDDPESLFDELAPNVPEGELTPLMHSECLWMPAPVENEAENVLLTWEVAGRLTAPDIFLAGTVGVGLCTGTDPVTRQWILDPDGGRVDFLYLVDQLTGLVTLTERTAPADDDPYNRCTVIETPGTSVGSLAGCVTLLGRPDGPCSRRCGAIVEEDTTFHLQTALGGHVAEKTLRPTLKIVDGSRRLAREMRFDAARSDAGENRFVFTWSVVRPDGSWLENFSLRLHAASVRVFREQPNGEREYLTPLRIRAGGADCAPGGTDPTTVFPAEDCDPSLLVTPAYERVAPEIPLDWEVSFQEDPRGTTDTAVFIEFDVVGGRGVLHLSPPAVDFGEQIPGSRGVKHLYLENVGTGPVQILDIRPVWGHVAEFAGTAIGRTPPFQLSAGELVAVEVTAEPISIARKRAGLGIFTSESPPADLAVIPVTVNSVEDARLVLFTPPNGRLSLNASTTTTQIVVVQNVGSQPFSMRWELGGSDPGHFRVLSDWPTARNPNPSPPMNNPILQPGEFQDFFIEYRPTGGSGNPLDRLTHRAELAIYRITQPATPPVEVIAIRGRLNVLMRRDGREGP